MAFIYFDSEHAIQVHDEIIAKSGGIQGILNIGLLESVIEHVQNDMYYPEIEHKVTHLLFSINKNHAFQDGNKRSSVALSAYFMELNGFDYFVTKFFKEIENIVVDVADNRVSKDLLFEIISSILYEDDYSEELKLKLVHAKTQN
jgi:death-on-curing protein